MLIYEISTTVESGLAADYEKYMTERHIPDLLGTGYFSAAFFAKNGLHYRVGYHADSQEQLDGYFMNDAERLRSEFTERFPRGIEVTRQNLEIIALCSGNERQA